MESDTVMGDDDDVTVLAQPSGNRAISISSASSSSSGSFDELALRSTFIKSRADAIKKTPSTANDNSTTSQSLNHRPLLISDVSPATPRNSSVARFQLDGIDEDHVAVMTAIEIEDRLNTVQKANFLNAGKVVEVILEEDHTREDAFLVRFLDESDERLSLSSLQALPQGLAAIEAWRNKEDLSDSEDDLSLLLPRRGQRTRSKIARRQDSSDEMELSRRYNLSKSSSDSSDGMSGLEDDDDDDVGHRGRAFGRRNMPRRTLRQRITLKPSPRSGEGSDDELTRSDTGRRSKRKRSAPTAFESANATTQGKLGSRRSNRATRYTDVMNEIGEDLRMDNEEVDSGAERQAAVKISAVKEIFQPLPKYDVFRTMHQQYCDSCGENRDLNTLVFCQSCSLAYHKECLGPRGSRDHLVSKVGYEHFVLQCRRCVNVARSKEPHTPDMAMCQSCHTIGESSQPFRVRQTAVQEQREREENQGEDPITRVKPGLLNSAKNVLFRCVHCWRAFHYRHLPAKKPAFFETDVGDLLATKRVEEYSTDWRCMDCTVSPPKVGGLIAWRPANVDNYVAGTPYGEVDEDAKEYLIRWENQSYFKAEWRPGAWTYGVTVSATRKAFAKRETGPKMRTEDAIPEEYLRIDIILSVKYKTAKRKNDHRIEDVDEALIKYKGLGYEDATWDKVPCPDDGDRWIDFETAYHDWLLASYIHQPSKAQLQERLAQIRKQDFINFEMKAQPDNLVGGELMDYQLQGLNWLYYQWHRQQNAILADEMGLGKTIQIIGFLTTLIQHDCYPFLIVVPNSTCANWRREIKTWSPNLRVVTYFGSAKSREMAYTYEMYPEKSKELRCHVVVTSFEAAADEACRKVLKSVPWQGLIVDEGQRLKSDKSQLYNSLLALKIPFRVLLTGTPLQNNARELFNLLQFLDDKLSAERLETEYSQMNQETVRKLHELIRPFILRRTKVEVLSFLPPMAQIIVPLSMSVLQKKLYKLILSKSPELLKAIFAKNKKGGKLKPNERAGLSNILMQLRKCLCHPFVYSQDIEERTDIASASHRNLVEASAKLKLLELLLPKLRARGHRVLIFSQFLDMLSIVEDFLDGLQLPYQRLDGTMGSLEKQKRIDEFNAPGSPLFAFLLSTRAGGVGINLATADTVIILDPDFNPHQDIQAISRAHRIGQKKKVLCFQFMTRSSAEEKIFQIGRKKMALDHVVVQNLDKEDDMEDGEVEAMLRHGAAELFAEESAEDNITYDAASVNRLLDRSQIENTKAPDGSVESQFSFARVWANEKGTLTDEIDAVDNETDAGVWESILQERERVAKAEEAARSAVLGRGKRVRALKAVDYATGEEPIAEEQDGVLPIIKRAGRKQNENDSDTDFMAESESDRDEDGLIEEAVAKGVELDVIKSPGNKAFLQATKTNKAVKPFQRATDVPTNIAAPPPPAPFGMMHRPCLACTLIHPKGECPLKIAGVEHCNLCGLAHYGIARTCPHFSSETQVRAMIEALKMSTERKDLVDAALKYLKGVKGHIVQRKKIERGEAVGGGPPRNKKKQFPPPVPIGLDHPLLQHHPGFNPGYTPGYEPDTGSYSGFPLQTQPQVTPSAGGAGRGFRHYGGPPGQQTR